MAGYIPLDILVNHIFINLPVKALLNCSCVCKLWFKTISGLEFKRIHAQHQTKDVCRHQKLMCGPLKYRYSLTSKHRMMENDDEFRNKESACRGIFYSLDLQSKRPKLNRLPGFLIHHTSKLKLGKTLCYSNGMLCMEVWNESDYRWPYIFFGNPSTGCHKILPKPLVNGPFIVGFGYDSSTDDYKFVRIDNITRQPHIYSLKSNSWTINKHSRSDKLKSALEVEGSQGYVSEGCFLDGSIYWYANRSIIIFNFKEEKFTEMDIPPGFVKGFILLYAIQGSLCIIDRQRFCIRSDMEVNMWLLKSKEKKKKNIIEKKYYITKLLKLSSLFAESIYPLSFTEDGKVICSVEYRHEFKDISPPASHYILVDPKTSSYKDFRISGINSGIFKEFIFQSDYSGYVDTFVSHNVH